MKPVTVTLLLALLIAGCQEQTPAPEIASDADQATLAAPTAVPADCVVAAPRIWFHPVSQFTAAGSVAPIELHITNQDGATCPPRNFGAFSRGISGGGDGDYLPYPTFLYSYPPLTLGPGQAGTQKWSVRVAPAGEVTPPSYWTVVGSFRMPDGSIRNLTSRVDLLTGPVPSNQPSPYQTPGTGECYDAETIGEVCAYLKDAVEDLRCP